MANDTFFALRHVFALRHTGTSAYELKVSALRTEVVKGRRGWLVLKVDLFLHEGMGELLHPRPPYKTLKF